MPIGAMHVAATRIQRWWRFGVLPFLDRSPSGTLTAPETGGGPAMQQELWGELPLYHVAALEIQRAVRRTSRGVAARRIQAWLRRLASSTEHKSVFAYFRDLCSRFQRGCTPLELLRVVNPREAGLADAAADLSVMLRLGGAAFPPGVYYKVSTGAAVCSIEFLARKPQR